MIRLMCIFLAGLLPAAGGYTANSKSFEMQTLYYWQGAASNGCALSETASDLILTCRKAGVSIPVQITKPEARTARVASSSSGVPRALDSTLPRLRLTATKLPVESHRGVVGVLVRGTSIYEGEACAQEEPVAISASLIRQALIGNNNGVLSLATAQLSAEQGRSRKERVALALVTYVPPIATAALGLGAVGSIHLSARVATGIAAGAWAGQQAVDLLRPQVQAVHAALPGIWLDSLPDTVLSAHQCTPLLRWMGLWDYKHPDRSPTTINLSVQ